MLTDARSVCDDEITRREVDLFCELIPLQPNQRILDLCGGHGRHALEMCQRGYAHCAVLDYSDALLAIGAKTARRSNCAIEFVQGDARRIQYQAHSFDHVLILGNSLGYIPDPKADEQIIIEGLRVLQPGGWLLIDVTNGAAVRRTFAPNAWHEIGDDVVVCRQRELEADRICAREMVLHKETGLVRDRTYGMRLYTPQGLTDLVGNAGFVNIEIFKNFSPLQSQDDLGFMNHRMIVVAQKP